MRGTGPLVNRGLWKYPLPEPVARGRVPNRRTTRTPPTMVYGDSSMKTGKPLCHRKMNLHMVCLPYSTRSTAKDELTRTGRSWSYAELSIKSFDDLHKLYWLCVKEQNQLLTREKEMTRVRAGFGLVELEEKLKVVSSARPSTRKFVVL